MTSGPATRRSPAVYGMVLLVLLAVVGWFAYSLNSASQSCERQTYTAAPAMSIDVTHSYRAVITTNRGEITLILLPSVAPLATNNFVFLAQHCFYDGLTFHRVEDWVIQGGDPKGDGTGGPGYTFNDEPVTRPYTTGTLAMANSGPNSNGSQFFILKQDRLTLPASYTVFGYVFQGQNVVGLIQKGDVMERVSVTDEGVARLPSPSPAPVLSTPAPSP
ncbi:MAG: peptidylprolyl isomerase [Candidatus Dormibacteria bacterium]